MSLKLEKPYSLDQKIKFKFKAEDPYYEGLIKGIVFDQAIRIYIVECSEIKSEKYPYTCIQVPESECILF